MDDYRGFTEALKALFIWLLPLYIGSAHEQLGDKIKPDGTPAGSLDHLSLAELRKLVHRFFPDDLTVGEEDGPKETGHQHNLREWELDGLDGSANRRMGTNSFGGALSLRQRDEVLYAATFRPIDYALRGNGFFYAEKDKGAWQWCNKHQQYHQLHSANNLERMVVLLEGSSKKFFQPPISELGQAVTTRASVSSCVAATAVAQGLASALVTVENKPWDNLSSILFMQEAGCIVTDWQGNEPTFQTSGNIIGAGNAADHREILDILAKGNQASS